MALASDLADQVCDICLDARKRFFFFFPSSIIEGPWATCTVTWTDALVSLTHYNNYVLWEIK